MKETLDKSKVITLLCFLLFTTVLFSTQIFYKIFSSTTFFLLLYYFLSGAFSIIHFLSYLLLGVFSITHLMAPSAEEIIKLQTRGVFWCMNNRGEVCIFIFFSKISSFKHFLHFLTFFFFIWKSIAWLCSSGFRHRVSKRTWTGVDPSWFRRKCPYSGI